MNTNANFSSSKIGEKIINLCKNKLNGKNKIRIPDKFFFDTFNELKKLPDVKEIKVNSIYFIARLEWANPQTQVMKILNKFISSAIADSSTITCTSMLQSWRVFAVGLCALAQDNLVQAVTLLETCFRLACFNYITNGDVTNCFTFLNLDNKLLNLNNKSQKNSKLCDTVKCMKMDDKHDSESNEYWFPCYPVLKKICSDKKIENFFSKIIEYHPNFRGVTFSKMSNCIRDCRNALAHGNLKQGEKWDLRYNDLNSLVRDLSNMIIDIYFLLKVLTSEVYSIDGNVIKVGMELYKASKLWNSLQYSCGFKRENIQPSNSTGIHESGSNRVELGVHTYQTENLPSSPFN